MLIDSGERREAATGAVRDVTTGKPETWLLSPYVVPCIHMRQYLLTRDTAPLYARFRELVDVPGGWQRVCDHLAAGVVKYDAFNWAKGMPLSWGVASYLRHWLQADRGDRDEDHYAAQMCNAMFLIHWEAEVAAGRLPNTLDDLPHYDTINEG